MTMTATGYEQACPSCRNLGDELLQPIRSTGHTCGWNELLSVPQFRPHEQVLGGQMQEPAFRAEWERLGVDDLLAALAPFLQCGATMQGRACWPRCDGPERRVLAEAVERVKEAQCQPR